MGVLSLLLEGITQSGLLNIGQSGLLSIGLLLKVHEFIVSLVVILIIQTDLLPLENIQVDRMVGILNIGQARLVQVVNYRRPFLHKFLSENK